MSESKFKIFLTRYLKPWRLVCIW